MISTTENIPLISSLLLLISIIAGRTTYRFGVPVLILFLTIGMPAGSEGIGRIDFDDPKMAQFVGIVSLNFILFSGGLDTSWASIKPVLWQGISLSTLGVFLTALSLGFSFGQLPFSPFMKGCSDTWKGIDLVYESLKIEQIS